MKNIVLLFLLVSFAPIVYATQLDGTYEEQRDGTYNVNVSDGYHEYYGYAEEFDDDTLEVRLKDNSGKIYVGKGVRNLHGGYTLDLHDEANGDSATGYIEAH